MQPTGIRVWLKHADLLLLLLWTWFYASYSISALTQPDQGTFAAFGYHLLQGKTLYTDFFDHKPPAIYLLNAAFMALGGVSENTIAWFVMGFSLLQVWVFYRLLQVLGFSRLAIFSITLCFITAFFRYELFGTGNFTEQYGALATTSALLFFLRFLKSGRTHQLVVAAGLWGLAFSFKEPFLFSCIPAFLWLCFSRSSASDRWKSGGLFALGFAIPLLLQLIWLWTSGSWAGYYDHLQHSMKYTTHGEPVWLKIIKYHKFFFYWFSLNYKTTLIIYLLAIPGLFLARVPGAVVFLLLGQQVCDYAGTSLTGNGWHHYYMQSTPLMVIVMVWGISGYFRWFKGRLWSQKPATAAILLCLLMCWQVTPWRFVEKGPEKHWYDEIEHYLNREGVKRPVNLALAREEFGFYYVRLQALSPMRYIVPYPYHWVITDEKEKQAFLHAEYQRFVEHPPEYIITGTEYAQAWIDAGIDTLARRDYVKVSGSVMPEGRLVFLLRHK